jgi:hypothetical protein
MTNERFGKDMRNTLRSLVAQTKTDLVWARRQGFYDALRYNQAVEYIEHFTGVIKAELSNKETSSRSIEDYDVIIKNTLKIARNQTFGAQKAAKYLPDSDKFELNGALQEFNDAHKDLCYHLASLKPWGERQ